MDDSRVRSHQQRLADFLPKAKTPPPSFGGRERDTTLRQCRGARRRHLAVCAGRLVNWLRSAKTEERAGARIRRHSKSATVFIATLPAIAHSLWDQLSKSAGGSTPAAIDDMFQVIVFNIFTVVLYYLGYFSF
jgi:hypothetical protein